MEFLQDFTFLQKLNHHTVKEFWAAIVLLDFPTERPLKRIEAKVVSGNINVAANSPTRRTGSLTLVFDEEFRNITDVKNLIAIDKKIALSVGMTNPFYHDERYRQYGDILWFKQGTFIITKASSTVNTTSSSISINFVDKMALLNGTCGGVLPSTVSFHELLITQEDGTMLTEYPLVSQIVRECVQHFGGEHPSRIIVSDIEDVGRHVVTYEGSKPIRFRAFADIDGNNSISGYKPDGSFVISDEPMEGFPLVRFKGDIVGYLETPLTYPGELIMKSGSTVTQVLDQIVNALGNYEYFYDVEGCFHFQRISNFVATGNTPLNFGVDLSGIVTNDNALHSDESMQQTYLPKFAADSYMNEFQDTSLVTSVQFSPAYDKIKNDFIVWGTRNSNEENAKLVRFHLAIDERPRDSEDALCHKTIYMVYKYPLKKDENGNNVIDEEGEKIPITYLLVPSPAYSEDDGYHTEPVCRPLDTVFQGMDSWYHFNWREEIYRMALLNFGQSTDVMMTTGEYQGYQYYFEEMRAEWRNLYDPESTIENKNENSFQKKWEEYYGNQGDKPWYGYNVDVAANPAKITYWLDILDTDSTLGQFSIKRIGRRTVAKENSKVNEVFQHSILDIVFIDVNSNDWKDENLQKYWNGEGLKERLIYYASIGQTVSLLSNATSPYFQKMNSYGTCFEDIRELLYTNLIYNSAVTLTSIPIFYLEVNRILRLNFPELGITGDYVINQLSWQLGKTPTMNISLQEAMVLA